MSTFADEEYAEWMAMRVRQDSLSLATFQYHRIRPTIFQNCPGKEYHPDGLPSPRPDEGSPGTYIERLNNYGCWLYRHHEYVAASNYFSEAMRHFRSEFGDVSPHPNLEALPNIHPTLILGILNHNIGATYLRAERNHESVDHLTIAIAHTKPLLRGDTYLFRCHAFLSIGDKDLAKLDYERIADMPELVRFLPPPIAFSRVGRLFYKGMPRVIGETHGV